VQVNYRIIVGLIILVLVALSGHRFVVPSLAQSPIEPMRASAQQPSAASAPSAPSANAEAARKDLTALYEGDYRHAFLEKRPELFLKHIAPNFHSTTVDGTEYDATALRRFFPQQFVNVVRVHEHNVTIEDIDIAKDGTIAAVVTLTTLIEYRNARRRSYFVLTMSTYHDHFIRSSQGMLMETGGDQLRAQTITWPSS
jgi:hypothetical protein